MDDMPTTLSSSSDEELPETSFLLSSQYDSKKQHEENDETDVLNASSNYKNETIRAQQQQETAAATGLSLLEATTELNNERPKQCLITSSNTLHETNTECLDEPCSDDLIEANEDNENDDICDLMNRSLLITNELHDDYVDHLQYTPIKSTRSSFIIHTTEKSNLFDESDTSIILTRRQRQATTKESDIHRRRNIIYDSDEDEDDLEDCNNSDNKRHSGNTSITVNPAINDDILPPDISQITNFYTPQKDMEHSKEGQHSPVMENTPATTRIHSTGNTPFFTPISTLIDHDTTSHRYHTPLPTKTDTNSVDLLVDQLDKTIILSDDESEVESVLQKIVPTTKRGGRVYKCCTAGYCQPLPPRITQKWVLHNISKPREHDISWLVAQRDLTPLQFRRRREKLAAEFYRIFNQTVFDQLLPEDMSIVWCNKGRTTGGLCDLGIEKDDAGNVKAKPVIRLIEKVLDNADRLAEVLVHEMTHAATFVINRTCKARHGPIFRAWCKRINIIYPSLKTANRHNFKINYKYQWQCTNDACGLIVGRHSKSLDITRLICGKCHSRFVQIQPVPKQ